MVCRGGDRGDQCVLYSVSRGEKPSLDPVKIQYSDYAVWQREWLQGDVLESQLAYWRGKLQGPPVMELPSDKPRGAELSRAGAIECLSFLPELVAGLRDYCQREGVTLFMAILAAAQFVIGRCSGTRDVLVGTPVANHSQVETDRLIGLFVNTIVLRTVWIRCSTFRELLRNVRETVLEAYAHQDVPFEKVVDEFDTGRSLDRSPLFQVLMVLQNTPRTSYRAVRTCFTACLWRTTEPRSLTSRSPLRKLKESSAGTSSMRLGCLKEAQSPRRPPHCPGAELHSSAAR